MDGPKRKISVTLDAELLAELTRGAGSISAQLNEALRAEIHRRRRQAGWQGLLDDLLEVDGPLDTPEDLAAMEQMEQQWRELDRLAEQEDREAGPARVDRRAS